MNSTLPLGVGWLRPLFFVVAWLLAACGPGGDAVPTGVLNTIVIAPAAGTAGKTLRDPVVLRVETEDGEAQSGVVILVVAQDGGNVGPPVAQQTDARGEIRFTWTLGPASGEQRVLVFVAGQSVITVSVQSLAGPVPSTIRVLSGDNQRAALTCRLPDAVTFEVTDADGIQVPGASVLFGGDASADPPTAMTDAEGKASARWTMPAVIGSVRLEASVFPIPEPAVAHAESKVREPRVEIVSGDMQTVQQHHEIAQPLVLRLLDECDGTPWTHHPLEWSRPMPVKGPFFPTYFTDDSGYAQWSGYLDDAGDVSVSAAILLSYQSASFTVHVIPEGQRFDGDCVLNLMHPVYQEQTIRKFTFGIREGVVVPTGGDPVASASLSESDGVFSLISTTGFYVEAKLFFSNGVVLGGGNYGIGIPPAEAVPGVSRGDWNAKRL